MTWRLAAQRWTMNEYSRWLTGTELQMSRDLDQEFEARLAESSRLAFRVAYGVLRHREDAEDVAQEALTKAYRGFCRLRERDRYRAWLVRITWRMALDHRRSQKRRTARESVPTPNGPSETAADVLVARERSERLWEAIDALPEKLRIVTILAGIEEHDIREVSLLLDLPEGTVKSRLFLARQRMKELLQ
jgi:RNA polymerase sigma-70 factor (ECF subfamily)